MNTQRKPFCPFADIEKRLDRFDSTLTIYDLNILLDWYEKLAAYMSQTNNSVMARHYKIEAERLEIQIGIRS